MNLIEELLSKSELGRKELIRQEFIVSVTEQLWAALEAANLSKADLARSLGTSKANVTQLLSGQRNMTLSTLADLAAALNVRAYVSICKPFVPIICATTTKHHSYKFVDIPQSASSKKITQPNSGSQRAITHAIA